MDGQRDFNSIYGHLSNLVFRGTEHAQLILSSAEQI